MKTGNRRLGALATMLAILLSAVSVSVHAQVNVTTFHNDNSRTGQNTLETVLTPANVNSNSFGKVFTTALDGFVYAQPLYLANVTIAGGTHNVLYVATQHDSLYAIDADSGAILWQISLIAPGGTTISSINDLNCTDMVPEVGITGTPVIDTTTGTIYLVARSKVGGNFYQYLHAIDVSTAAEKFGGPMNIQATVAGTAADGTGTTVSFGTKSQNQRAGLLLENGHVVIGWASHCDTTPWHGWVMSYNAATLAQEAAYNTSPNGYGDGVWMSAGGIAADSAGDIYFATGNGSWNGGSDLGDSIVKLGPPSGGTFPVLDYFTPLNQLSLAENDLDVASGGLTLLPTLPNGKQLIVVQAKEGKIFLVDRNNMGKYCPNLTPACTGTIDTNIVQELPNVSVGVWGVPAYWNGYVYWGPANDNTQTADHLQAFSLNANNSGLLSTTAVSKSAQTFNYGAPVPSISANGTTNGILWGVDNSSFAYSCTSSTGTDCQTLYAYDATNLANLLYTSNQAPNYRDVPGGAIKYVTPIIANGKVYFGGQYSVSGYGLIAAPTTFSPAGGTYTSTQTVTLANTTPGATIYYTLDGSTPTTSSSVYTAPLTVSVTTTIKATARTSTLAGQVVSASYTINSASATAVNFGATANVAAIGKDGFAVPNGGIDGQGDAYSGSALGTTASWGGAAFTFGAAGGLDAASSTTLTLPAGNFSNLSILASGLNGNQVNQVFVVTYTDGTTTSITQSLSDWFAPQGYAGESIALAEPYRLTSSGAADNRTFYIYGYTFAIDSTRTVKSLTLPSNRNVVVLAAELLTNSSPAAAPTFSPAAGSYTGTQTVTLADSTSGAVIYYTLDGSTPTTGSAKYSAPLTVSATTTIKALATASGSTTSAVASATYTISAGSTPGSTAVSLAAAANVTAIGTDGSAVPNGGIDGQGYAYSGTLLGTTASWGGVTFTLGASGAPNAVSGATLNLPAGNFSRVSMLATGVNGAQAGQVFVVTYTDGTTTSITQSLSDWFSPQSYAGESNALAESYRLTPTGASDARTFYVYGYSFAIDNTRTVKSLTLPTNRGVVVLAVELLTGNPPAAAPTSSPAPGTYTAAQSVSLADSTSGAVIYYTLDGSTPTTSSAIYSAPLSVAATTTIKALATASGYTASAVTSATYTINLPTPAATPTFSPAAGTYTAAQTVSLGDSTSGAVIYYTLDGSTPTTGSAVYSAPLSVAATTTIKALATATGFTPSAVASATYTITAPTPAATPTFSPAAGTYTAAQTVSLADSTSGAVIYYTLDGSTPTTSSAVYGTPLSVSATTTIKALAAAGGYSTSAVASAAYTINLATPPVTSVNLGSAANVTAIGTNGAAVPNGGIDGKSYAYSGTALGTTASWGGVTFTLGTAGGFNAISSATLTLPAGNYSTLSLLATGVNGGQAGQAFVVTYTDGTTTTITQSLSDWYSPQGYAGESNALAEPYRLTPTGSSDARTFYVYGYTFAIDNTRTVKSLTLPNNRNVVVLAVELLTGNPPAATPTFSPAAGTYTAAQTVSLADSTSGAVIYYTLDGSTPTTSSAKYSAPLTVSATTTIKALATATGFTSSAVASATYTISVATPAATPTFSPAAGTYTAAQTVSLADSTSGAVIYYTLDGSTPTTSSTKYAAPLTVSATTTIKALATASGYATSAVASATYTINVPAATPTFSPAAGTYTAAQTVSLADSTSGAVIYYTLDGSTPTTSSTKYSSPLTVSATTTIKALATATGFTSSAVASATYTISAPTPAATPTFSPAAGTYTAAQSVGLVDTTWGAVIYYTLDGSTPTTSSAKYSSPLTVSATTTVKALATATGFTPSAVASATYTINSSSSPVTSVTIGSAANVTAIGTNGVAVPNGGIDGKGYAYSGTALGTTANWAGITFTLGAAGGLDAITSTTLTLPAGNFSKLSMLATGVNGGQGSQVFVVTYTDGTTTRITQGLSDWYAPQSYAGESIALTESSRLNPDGSTDNRTFYVYGYSFAIDNTRTVKSVTLPSNGNVVVLSLTLSP